MKTGARPKQRRAGDEWTARPAGSDGEWNSGRASGSATESSRRRKNVRVLNDAILRAALDLGKRDRARRKIIFIISDGREYGSRVSIATR